MFVVVLGIAAGPVIGLLDIGAAAGFAAGVEEIRSLTFMVCGSGPAAAAGPPTGVMILEVTAGSAGFAAVIADAAGIAEIGDDIFAASTFLSVSSTSAATQPAPVSVVLMASRETPSFIWEFI